MLRSLTLSAALMIGASTAAFAQDPQSGGTLNFTAPYGSTFGTMDIQSSSSTQDEFPSKAIHRSLYDWNSDKGEPELELASAVDVSNEGKTFTYTLRDATFHDGAPLTVDDIIYSYKRLATHPTLLPGRVISQTLRVLRHFRTDRPLTFPA